MGRIIPAAIVARTDEYVAEILEYPSVTEVSQRGGSILAAYTSGWYEHPEDAAPYTLRRVGSAMRARQIELCEVLDAHQALRDERAAVA
ncbi:hypothetical protein [Cellulomonas composti]|uniref:Uncharacterized protein n=1 Tax=Cellulomonas composti TaxID=266130 RepID=A0A511JBM7_9CELL|nr:hypothetical protein [Cellulomonas composti]GEL95395.1 hypothetical protein CCO02nite_20530 [Cellulomonas composti]